MILIEGGVLNRVNTTNNVDYQKSDLDYAEPTVKSHLYYSTLPSVYSCQTVILASFWRCFENNQIGMLLLLDLRPIKVQNSLQCL